MSSVIWPNDFQRILNEEWGGTFVTSAPTSYAPNKKGLTYFKFDCKSDLGLRELKNYISSVMQIPFNLINLYADKPLNENKNILGLNIPKEHVNRVLIEFVKHKDQIKTLLKNAAEHKDEVKLTPKFFKAQRDDFHGIFGHIVTGRETFCPELQSMAFHALSNPDKAQSSAILPNEINIFNYMIPPQGPPGPFIVINNEGKLDFANEEQSRKFIDIYKEILRERQSMLKNPPEDRYFDQTKGILVSAPAGTILTWFKTGNHEKLKDLAGATYWNSDRNSYYQITRNNIEQALKTEPKALYAIHAAYSTPTYT